MCSDTEGRTISKGSYVCACIYKPSHLKDWGHQLLRVNAKLQRATCHKMYCSGRLLRMWLAGYYPKGPL